MRRLSSISSAHTSSARLKSRNLPGLSEYDCGTTEGIEIRSIIESGEVIEPLRDRIIGRVSVHDVRDPFGGSVIVGANEEVTEDKATHVDASGVDHTRIRSVLTCASARAFARCALRAGPRIAPG